MPWRWPWEERLEWTGSFVSVKTDLRGAGKRQKPDWSIVLQEVVPEVSEMKSELKMNQYNVDQPRAKTASSHGEESILKYRFLKICDSCL